MEQEVGRDHASLFCDTNVLVRLLTSDPPPHAAAAERVLQDPSARVILTDVAIAELTYVMTGVGGHDRREVADAIGDLMELPSVLVADEFVLRDALDLWASYPRLHFVDAYLAALDRRSEGTAVLSFDRDFDGIEGVERVDPTQY
jgi:predicted nucleic acid-binding protein